MKIREDFIGDNNRIRIISNKGKPLAIPQQWDLLGSYDILVVIPDMHMYIHNSPLDNFKFGKEPMLDFLTYLNWLKADMESRDKVLRIYQIGDIYEMRFPSIVSPGSNASAAEIRMSNPHYDQIINMFDSVRTHLLYGNHDFELRHFPSFRFGAYEGKVYLEHGFTPSPWTENPNNTLWEPAQWAFKTLREIESLYYNLPLPWIDKDKHYAVGVTDGAIEQIDMPPATGYPKTLKKYYVDRMKNDPDSKGCRVTVIGHTHHPYLEARVGKDGNGYVFADAGAWTEGRSDFVIITEEEIAICHYDRKAV